MEQTSLFVAGAAVTTAFLLARQNSPNYTEVREFVKAPHTRSVLCWLRGKGGYCILPVGFSLQTPPEDLGDGTVLGLIGPKTFQDALLADNPSPDQAQLRTIIRETLLHYAQLVGTGPHPIGLGGWPALLGKHELPLRRLLSSSYPLVLEVLFPAPWFKRFIPGFGRAAK